MFIRVEEHVVSQQQNGLQDVDTLQGQDEISVWKLYVDVDVEIGRDVTECLKERVWGRRMSIRTSDKKDIGFWEFFNDIWIYWILGVIIY